MNEDDVKPRDKEGLVLVGFGKHKLPDMLKWMGTDKEEDLARAFIKWPPVYRREEICSTEDMKAALQYLAYLQDFIMEWEQLGSEEKENGDVQLRSEE